MATPKFDSICIEFMSRIADKFVSSFTAGSGDMPEGIILENKKYIESYINKSMFILFNNYWEAVKGDIQLFKQIFPELISVPTDVVEFDSGKYTIDNPYKNFFRLVGAITEDKKYITVTDVNKYTILISELYEEIDADESNPRIFQIGENKLEIFPDTIESAIIIYLKQPLNPEDGSFIEQNGNYDSPFNLQWNSKIAEIAEKLYKTDRQEV
ncbi:MAG: hypothetical protein PVH88_02140 [Ignavibacteria bacterium]|jgi:hypothetical protein